MELVKLVSILSRAVDPILHGLAATAICGALVYATTPWLYMSVANGLFWFGREWVQSTTSHRPKSPKDWSSHKHLEWILPTVVGVIASYVSHRYL